ncbi:gamma-type small acid-soluble spore protein [Bacillus cereus]|uniref:gamma-type small acid-soluble spore protein n=1 Tax=Bacillus cereus TaxID=1396 RepID=UPI000B7CCBBB|nr:gamma-type small acid-soluble spore protein [Bacillus cereus]
MNKKQQGYNKATSDASIQSTNASYGTEFATETNVQAVKQANAKAEAQKAQASGAQGANASYGTEFATETDVHAVKKQNAQSAAKKSQPSSSHQ